MLFSPSSEKVGQSLLRPESAESELLAPSAPGHSTPALAMEGAGTEACGAQAQLVEMLSLAWPLSTPSEPHLATIPCFSKNSPVCRDLWAGPGMGGVERWRVCCQGRAHRQGSKADSAVGKATVKA